MDDIDFKMPVKHTGRELVEVVRCKDCEHATMTIDGKYCKYCNQYTDDDGYLIEVYHDADWFCADGASNE